MGVAGEVRLAVGSGSPFLYGQSRKQGPETEGVYAGCPATQAQGGNKRTTPDPQTLNLEPALLNPGSPGVVARGARVLWNPVTKVTEHIRDRAPLTGWILGLGPSGFEGV